MYLGVEFTFNNTMSVLVDAFSMGSSPDPVLANSFVDFYENLFFENCKPYMYLRYADDIFSILIPTFITNSIFFIYFF